MKTHHKLMMKVMSGRAYEVPAYTNAGGTGDRQALITWASDILWNIAFATYGAYLIDGTQGDDLYINNGQAVADKYIEWGFGAPKKFTAIKFYFSLAFDCGIWKPQGFASGIWVDIGTNFTAGASATQEIVVDVTGATKLRIVGVSGNSSWDQYWREVEFKIGNQL